MGVSLLIQNFIDIIFVLLFSFIFHEGGHAYFFRKYLGKEPKYEFKKEGRLKFSFIVGTKKDYENVTHTQMFNIYMFGVFAGLLPFVFYSLITTNLLVLPALGLYLLLSHSDIINAFKEVYMGTRK